MTPDHVAELLAAVIAERWPPRDPPSADDELTKARRRRELNAALDDAPMPWRSDHPRQEAM